MTRSQLRKNHSRPGAPGDESCLVLSLSGQKLGVLGRFAGDRFSVQMPAGHTLWISSAAIYLENPRYVELICLADGLNRYVVSPPHAHRSAGLS